ncbi:MFS transporter [Rhodococcus wratislaviensis]|uniref:Putative proline/betaine transporter n=1 Tax=Rhodococcus wratislaviensis NBRC 100605 TaxID=1219028 RepID=X0Q8A1_RHOWR|nr:MFS transporter [Rhodococcus wratislaviensis]GAF47717.1 putative major facilitator superfamily transporter [Rhodococcus wratislaviensis NBRC 100605]
MTGTQRTPRQVRTAAIASLVGSALEWYDFFLYGTAAALVFNTLFFPTFDPLVGTIAAFGTNAAGFLARPLGGVIFGHFGDRVGRKSMLVVTLMIMGVATFLIGVLPTYHSIGVWAAVLLIVLRIVQGIAVGGEWGGGVLIVSEQAPSHRRGFYSAWSQTGVGLGFVLSASVYALVQTTTTTEAFLAWGWRIPFLAGIVLTVVGLLIRLRVMETPVARQNAAATKPARPPILEVLRSHRKSVLITFGARIAENGAMYVFLTFSLAYAAKIGLDSGLVLAAVVVGMLIESFAMPAWGALSDRVGRRPVYLGGAIAMIAWAYPFFALFDSGNPILVFLAVLVAVVICHGAMIGTQPAFFTELFDRRVRYSGVALGHELASVVAGGFSPIIATALFAWAGASWPIALFLIGMGVITVVSVAAAPETTAKDIDEQDTADTAEADTEVRTG